MSPAVRYLVILAATAVIAGVAGTVLAGIVFDPPEFVSSVGAEAVPVTVPDVIGMTRQEARTAIESSSLVLAGQWSEYGPLETMGTVIRQDPPPGAQTPRGAPVSIFWNTGPLYREFHPDSLVGLTAVEAEERIADWQLYSIGRSWVSHPSSPEGTVLAVSPRQYDSLAVHTPVRLLVSTGWEGVPRLTGMRPTDADSLLSGMGLVLRVSEERETGDVMEQGLILEQALTAGSPFAVGDTIDVVVGTSGSGWGTW